MSQTVFILGAGASKEGGAPVMADFLDVARDILKRELVKDSRRDFEAVFKAITALKVIHSNSRLNIENIETLFAACEMGKTLRKFPGREPGEIDSILKSLKRLIVRTIEATLSFEVTAASEYQQWNIAPPTPYRDFADLVRQLMDRCIPRQTVSVITFNYDIAADYALQFYGRRRVYYALGDPPPTDDTTVPVLKLHGSISWGQDKDDSSKILSVDLGRALTKQIFFTHRSGPISWAVSSNLKELGTVGEPVIVPPTWNKADSHRTLENVWSEAARQLSDAENIFVIGYSLPETDSFFRHLYALGTVGDTMLRRFWVFNPDTRTEERFRELLGPAAEARFEFNPPSGHARTFTEAIRYLGENVFPVSDD